ncbi:deoxycytidylate deaminase [Arthrobacter phage Brynnie]|nr:deoxycytidylate deaminase [Arthrobacter phage Brynnie]
MTEAVEYWDVDVRLPLAVTVAGALGMIVGDAVPGALMSNEPGKPADVMRFKLPREEVQRYLDSREEDEDFDEPAPAGPVLYLAGPMSGLPGFNYAAFHVAAGKLRRAGFEVLNPAENRAPSPDPAWSDWMRLALGQLLKADGVALLPGWRDSKGATVERNLARDLEVPALTVPAWLTKQGQTAYMGRLLNNTKEG